MPETVCSDILQLSNRNLLHITWSGNRFLLFTDSEKNRQDWRILQRLYRTELF